MTQEQRSTIPPESAEIVAAVRELAGVPTGTGPDDAHLVAGVRGFAEAFHYWYTRVIRESVPDYRNLIIKRINPFIRRIQLDGLAAPDAARRLVEDYDSRNFVTAGGWALEALASDGSPDAQKSAAEGIDLQRFDPLTGDHHLYVLKSGLVTRNSDIVKALKRNSRQAEKLLRQGRSTGAVHANWAVVAGKTSSTYEDGVNRPSSAEFWGEVFGLDEVQAVDLALAMAAVAGQMIKNDASQHLQALQLLVGDYIADRSENLIVDWEFLARRNMQTPDNWRAEDKARHVRALKRLAATGYVLTPKIPRTRTGSSDND
ncbi:PmeII family type II restriction endonuclease [Micromonospora sp. FIMYZ51]|uniref:PmeII family type II restriction endonuclease n=1 Tax=unclassified Micromonospora TaxID=2617518 RepID=UPI001375A2BB|nr:PmeII family type II restriction endonuclease [Verrucosispora sp. SN26_14.1]